MISYVPLQTSILNVSLSDSRSNCPPSVNSTVGGRRSPTASAAWESDWVIESLIAMSNRSECLIVQHGVSQAGAASVLVNPSWKHDEMSRAIALTKPKVFLTDEPLADVVDSIDGTRGSLKLCVDESRPATWGWFWDLTAESSGTRPPPLDADLSRLESLLPFSSGTTGLAKAVRHSHRSLCTAIAQRISAYGMTDADRLQFFMAMCTSYGMICSISSIAARSSFRLFRRFDAERILQNLEDEHITIAFGAAPVAIAFRELPDLERYDLSSLRYMMWGATPVLPEIANEVTARSGIRWMQAYSTTEVGIASNPATDPQNFGSTARVIRSQTWKCGRSTLRPAPNWPPVSRGSSWCGAPP